MPWLHAHNGSVVQQFALLTLQFLTGCTARGNQIVAHLAGNGVGRRPFPSVSLPAKEATLAADSCTAVLCAPIYMRRAMPPASAAVWKHRYLAFLTSQCSIARKRSTPPRRTCSPVPGPLGGRVLDDTQRMWAVAVNGSDSPPGTSYLAWSIRQLSCRS